MFDQLTQFLKVTPQLTRGLGVVAISATLALSAVPAKAALIAYYDFETSSISGGALVNQQNPGNSDGVMTDVITGQAGVFGEAFGFNAIGSLNLGGGVVTSQISGTNPWSISAWVNLGNDTSFSHILYRRDAAFDGSDAEGGLRINAGGAPQVFMQDTVANTTFLNSPVDLGIGEWTHVVGIREDAPGSGWRLYLDGVEFSAAGAPFSIGVASVAEIGVDLIGLLDEVRVYDHALTQSEVSALYAAGAAVNVSEPGMLAVFGLGLAVIAGARRRAVA